MTDSDIFTNYVSQCDPSGLIASELHRLRGELSSDEDAIACLRAQSASWRERYWQAEQKTATLELKCDSMANRLRAAFVPNVAMIASNVLVDTYRRRAPIKIADALAAFERLARLLCPNLQFVINHTELRAVERIRWRLANAAGEDPAQLLASVASDVGVELPSQHATEVDASPVPLSQLDESPSAAHTASQGHPEP